MRHGRERFDECLVERRQLGVVVGAGERGQVGVGHLAVSVDVFTGGECEP